MYMEYDLRVDDTEVVYVCIFNYKIATLLHCGNKTILDGVQQIMD
jgi:hypothetical protein